MRCPVVVGREEELAVLGEVLGAPEGGVCWVVGEAGIGKTRLVTELGRRARKAGRNVVTCRATLADRRTPYRPVTEALLMLTRECGKGLGPAVDPLVGTGDVSVGPSPVVLAETVLRTIRDVAGEGLLLIVEDVHWADPDTLAVVEYLADHAAEIRLVLVGSSRPPAGEHTQRVGRVLDLDRLTSSQVEAMAAACLGGPGLSPDQRRRVSAAAGLPLLVEDLLDSAARGRSARFDDLVAQRLAGLPDAARLVVDHAAVLGEHVTEDELAEATGLGPADLSAAVSALRVADLFTGSRPRWQFRHALTREAVLEQLSPTLRGTLSAHVAEVMQGRGADAAVVAELWQAAGDAERATAALRDCARTALGRGALATAEQLVRSGLDLAAPDDPARQGLVLDLANVLLSAGRLPELRAQGISFAAELTTAADLARLWLVLARAALASGALEDAQRHTDAARRALSDAAGLAPEVAVLDAQIALAASQPGRVAAAEHLAGQAVGLARAAGRPELECEALETAALCARTRDLDAADRELQRALGVASTAGLHTWRMKFLNESGAVEMLRDARGDWLRQALDEASSAGALGIAAGVLCNLAALHTMTCQWDTATAYIAQAADLADRLGMVPLHAAAVTLEAVMHACRGERHAMERCVRHAAAILPADDDMSAMAALAAGLQALTEEDRPRATAAFGTGLPCGVARTLDAPAGPALLLSCLAGDAGAPEVTASREHQVRGARWDELWLSSAEAVAVGATDPEAAMAFRAMAMRAGEPTPVFATLAQRLLAEAAWRDNWGDPVAWLAQSERAATDLGLPRVAAACRTLLYRAGGRPVRHRAGDLLVPAPLRARGITAREAEVLDLVADRLQNREIADRLFLSARTVEKHVASLLAKCDVPDRAGLVALGLDARLGRMR